MKTIKRKLILIFTIFMVSFVIGGIGLNIIFLKKYYIYKNKNIFLKTSSLIKEEYNNNKENISTLLNEINLAEGISCIITDNKFDIKYNSAQRKVVPSSYRVPREIQNFIVENEEKLEKKYLYSIINKERDNLALIVFSTKITDKSLIILTKPLKGVNENVAISNQFYVIAGVIIMIIGSIFINILSKKITKPIIEMSNVAENISNLDFSKHVNINSKDEIEVLGESINKLSEKLSQSMSSLKEDIKRRKQLVRNMSHELKTPIGVIKGYAEGLKYGVADDKEKIDKYCSVIVDECNLMDNMVRELLDLSMLESGVFKLEKVELELCQLINHVIDIFNNNFHSNGIKVKYIYEEPINILADKELLERVMKNLITNAINHSDGEKYIEIECKKSVNKVVVSVYNTGKHIPEEDINNIWEVFSKVDKVRTIKYGGHGIGLSIVQLIIKLHKGDIKVKNVKDGVVFYFNLNL